jgi:mannose-1-phosphate guanylyltransferase
VLSCGYLSNEIERHFGSRLDGLDLSYLVEETPLGTGGAIASAARSTEGSILAMNGDCIREVDLGALLAFHGRHDTPVSMLLTVVADLSDYGSVRVDSEGFVTRFVEKPRQHRGRPGLINAGVYVIERDVLDRVPPAQPVSLERDVLPDLVDEGLVRGVALPGYFLDVGTPASFLQANRDVLTRVVASRTEPPAPAIASIDKAAEIRETACVVPPAYVGPGAVIERGAIIGALSVVGPRVHVGERATIVGSVVAEDARIGVSCQIENAIVGERSVLGPGSVVCEQAVIGPEAVVGAECRIRRGARIDARRKVGPGTCLSE